MGLPHVLVPTRPLTPTYQTPSPTRARVGVPGDAGPDVDVGVVAGRRVARAEDPSEADVASLLGEAADRGGAVTGDEVEASPVRWTLLLAPPTEALQVESR
jgi:hypothetical protein